MVRKVYGLLPGSQMGVFGARESPKSRWPRPDHPTSITPPIALAVSTRAPGCYGSGPANRAEGEKIRRYLAPHHETRYFAAPGAQPPRWASRYTLMASSVSSAAHRRSGVRLLSSGLDGGGLQSCYAGSFAAYPVSRI